MRVSDRPIDPNILPPILTVSVFVSDFNNRCLIVTILTLSDKCLIETDLLKIGFLFEFSFAFPCTFERCLDK